MGNKVIKTSTSVNDNTLKESNNVIPSWDWMTLKQLHCLVFGYCQNNLTDVIDDNQINNTNFAIIPDAICKLIINVYLEPRILILSHDNNHETSYIIYDPNRRLTLKNVVNKLKSHTFKNNCNDITDINLYGNINDFGFIFASDNYYNNYNRSYNQSFNFLLNIIEYKINNKINFFEYQMI